MDTIHQKQANSKKYTRLAAGAVAAFGLLCITGRAISDPPETMAPPIQAGAAIEPPTRAEAARW